MIDHSFYAKKFFAAKHTRAKQRLNALSEQSFEQRDIT